MLVWDAAGSPPVGDGTVLLWRSFEDDQASNTLSLPKLVEGQADAYRARFLAWVHDLGRYAVRGQTIQDHLELQPGLSYWWLTPLAQKFNVSGSSQIDNAIKALALEAYVAEYRPRSLVLVTGNTKLAGLIRAFCHSRGIDYRHKPHAPGGGAPKTKTGLRAALHRLPDPVKAVLYLVWHVLCHLPAFVAHKPSLDRLAGSVCLVDILVHLDRASIAGGRFISNYWTLLVDLLGALALRSNWLHNYFPHDAVSSRGAARSLLAAFNTRAAGTQCHVLLDSYLNAAVVAHSLKFYLKLLSKSRLIAPRVKGSSPNGSCLDFGSLFHDELIGSLRDHTAALNCLRTALYLRVFHCLPPQGLGIYIQENQPWEMALIHAWRSAGHGKLIGVPHTTVRYWDLRYFHDPRCYAAREANRLPVPDRVAVNGPIAKHRYVEGGYPESQLVEAEALRFLHLVEGSRPLGRQADTGLPRKILICGDFLRRTTLQLISWMSSAARQLPSDNRYYFKPHPAYPVDFRDNPFPDLELRSDPLPDLLKEVDLVLTSSITSAAVDAYCAGVRVIQMLDGEGFNTSPLRGLTGVVYVASSAELLEAIGQPPAHSPSKAQDYFYLDPALPRWRSLLAAADAEAARF